ncbi:sensor domain-containing diguanylate cyclase [Salidesulfovibrio onnuriiensis]|uniref:sensor domain-containing diguanylate cyclase n=1 Tax=Salidesulfovibrio onnuriiensis TaxID=2583823 RepID=UPI0011C90F46|nr:sensor domain-containing diguanylate cyclase [Salidesulfovibrio onnuriiensis]
MDIHWLVQECRDPVTLQRLFYFERYSWLALSHDMAAVISTDGMFEDLNTHWEMVTGHSREAMQQSYLIEYIHFDDREKTLAELQALITSDIASTSTTFRFRCKDGEHRSLHFNVIYSPDHEAYFCVARDIGKEADADKLAYKDALTGLPNRLALDKDLPEILGRAKDVGTGVAAMFIDLDGFKEVNDTLGHKAGDSLLMRAAQRMRQCVGDGGLVYRLAGDEFIILAPRSGERTRASDLAALLLKELSAPYRIEEDTVQASASIGLALFPQDAGIPVALLDCADKAMYHVKRHGKSNFTFFGAAFAPTCTCP